MSLFGNSMITTFSETGEIMGTIKGTSKEQVVSGEALIGFNHFLSENVLFNSAIGYTYGMRTQTGSYSSTGTFFLSSTQGKSTVTTGRISWSFGFAIILSGKKQSK